MVIAPDEGAADMPNEDKLQLAIKLIKQHITEQNTKQNRELHKAIGLVVDVAREWGMLTK